MQIKLNFSCKNKKYVSRFKRGEFSKRWIIFGTYINFINLSSNKLVRIVLFTSIFQLKLLSECEELYIDGTFQMGPKNYYQILNIWGFPETKKIYILLINILMTSKNQNAYKHAFNK